MASGSGEPMDTTDNTGATQTPPDSNSAVSQNQNPDFQHAVQQAAEPQHMQTSPNTPPGMNQSQNQHQLVALQAAGFQHMQTPPNIPPGMNQFQNQHQLVVLQPAGFQHMQTQPNIPPGMNQFQNQYQLAALQPSGFQHMQTSPDSNSGVYQNQNPDFQYAVQQASYPQHMQTQPNIPPGMNQFQNQYQLVALQAPGFQHTQTRPDLNSAVSQNQNPDSQYAAQQASDPQHMQTQPNIPPGMNQFQNQPQLVALQAPGFQHMQTAHDSNSGVYQNQNPDFQHAAQQAAAFQHTQTVSQNQNPDSQYAAQQASDPQHMQTSPNIPPGMHQFQNQPQLVVLQPANFQHTQTRPDLNSAVSQNQNPDSQYAVQQAAALQHMQTSPNIPPGMNQFQNPPQLVALAQQGADLQHMQTPPDSNSGVYQIQNQFPDSQHAVQQPADPQHTQTTPDSNSGVALNQNPDPDSHVNPAITKQPGKVQDDLRERTACSKTNSQELSMSSQTVDIYTSGDGGAAGGAESSAPLDTAKVKIRVEWTEEIPSRWEKRLQKALQSWSSVTLSKHVGEDCDVMSLRVLHDSVHAVAEISPSRALDVLKKLKSETLTFKELKCSTTVHFLVDEVNHLEPRNSVLPMEEKKIPKEDNMDLNKSEKNHKEAAAAMRGDPNGAETPQHADRSGDPPALTVPIPQFWYFSHAFRKELRQFEEQWGVRINAEVSVSIKAEGASRRDSVQEAAQKFTDFYQENTRSLKSTEIPQTQLESDYVKEVVRHVQSDQTKMMLNLSAGRCQLFGPGPVISAVQKKMNLESHMETGRSFSNDWTDNMELQSSDASGSWSSQTAKPVEMDIKDSPDPIVMSEIHYELIQKTSQKQIQDIEIKYGVLLTATPSQGSVKVTLKSNNEHVNLESHALRAFTHLYQKVATTAVACSLKRPAEGKTVAQALGKLGCPDYFVGIEEKNDVWKLVGLPKHLGPVITEIEKLVGKSVFDDKTKELVGYPGNFPESWVLRGGQQEVAAAKWTHGIIPDSGKQAKNESGKDIKEKDDDKSKDDDCPICMDKFTDKKKLKCGHEFCRACLNESVKSMGEICPVCKNIFGKLIGTQPVGTMTVNRQSSHLPGYRYCGTIEIVYDIPGGTQTERHPNPGKPFYGAHRRAYLPDNVEGREVLTLLQRAFDQRLIFTVGTSTTTGADNSVIWNDIHHKTNTSGGSQNYGYPDDSYLKRVKEELKAKGIE